MGKKIAIVTNKLAGYGLAISISHKIAEQLQQKGIVFELFKEEWPPQFDSFTAVWIVGGDGTLNYFINHYPDISLPLMIFKGGTGNDFHWLLYKNCSLEEQIETGLKAIPTSIDAGSCNGKLFLNGLGVGFDGSVASVLQGKEKRAGKFSYLLAIIKTVFLYREQEFTLTFSGKEIHQKLLMVNIMNGKREGGGFYVTPDADVTDGLFQANLVQSLSVLKRLYYLPVIEKGKHVKLSFVNYFSTPSMHITSKKNFGAHLDGEFFTTKEIEVHILPGKFRFCF